jgi:hypothetical protein
MAVAVALVLSLIAGAGQASAATHVYASGTLGAGGAWTNPAPGSFLPMNFSRMTVSGSNLVIAQFYLPSGFGAGDSSTTGFVQISNPGGLGTHARARCVNSNNYNLSGQCIWYD